MHAVIGYLLRRLGWPKPLSSRSPLAFKQPLIWVYSTDPLRTRSGIVHSKPNSAIRSLCESVESATRIRQGKLGEDS
jgi:hypothetical protein